MKHTVFAEIKPALGNVGHLLDNGSHIFQNFVIYRQTQVITLVCPQTLVSSWEICYNVALALFL